MLLAGVIWLKKSNPRSQPICRQKLKRPVITLKGKCRICINGARYFLLKEKVSTIFLGLNDKVGLIVDRTGGGRDDF